MKHPIPNEALDDRLGFTGTSGAGKTYSAGTVVERVLERRGRVVIIDPLGVWYGLRLHADGKTPSPHDVVIFGGPHGDLPITEHAGALIGETVAGMAESCILDLSAIGSKAAERRFMLALLTALYRNAAGEPVHVIFDEADMWAPQRLLDRDGDAAKLLGMMETIVRRGRVKGFIPWLITQRPAVLSKDILSQVDGLVTFKLTSSQDRDAIGAWVEGSAEKQQWRDIWARLPTMERGQGVVWVPARGILSTVKFPEKQTFDSSRTPKRGESKRTATLKPINLDKLQERLASVKAEVDANDPKALRVEITRLKGELAKKPAEAAPVDTAEIERRAWARGKTEGYGGALGDVDAIFRDIAKQVTALRQVFEGFEESTSRIQAWADRTADKRAELETRWPASPRDVLPRTPSNIPMPPVQPTKAPRPNGADTLPGPQQRILNSLATWAQMGEHQPNNAQVAWLAGYSPSSTSYTNPRSALKSAGLIDYPAKDQLAITADGAAVAAPFALMGTLIEFVLSLLPGPEARILRSVAGHYPRQISNDEAATGANYSASSTSYTNPRSALRTKDLITYPAKDQVRAADWLFAR
jgi:hypothetical protein